MDRGVWVCFMPSDFVFVFPYALSKLRMESGYARWEKNPNIIAVSALLTFFPAKERQVSRLKTNTHKNNNKINKIPYIFVEFVTMLIPRLCDCVRLWMNFVFIILRQKRSSYFRLLLSSGPGAVGVFYKATLDSSSVC